MIKKEHIILPNMSFEEGVEFIEKQYVLPFETEKRTSYYSLESNETWLEIKDILKRNEPIKPYRDDTIKVWSRCPKCHYIVNREYCSHCGQRLDWER